MDWKAIWEEVKDTDPEQTRKRISIVEEAISWLGTPYHENANVKGIGVDCGMILIEIYSAAGVIEWFDPRPYPAQWAFNQKAERYLELVQKFAHEVSIPLPGNVALFKVGHCWAHGAIVTNWPNIIHANPPGECREENCELNFGLKKRVARFFSVWEN